MKKKDRVFAAEVQSISDQHRILRFVTSTETPDRDGDVLLVSGWQTENYMKNPVVLFGHDYSSLPVGRTVNIELDIMNKRMIQDIQFAKKEEYEFADTVYRMTKAGYLNTTSVGFMGIEHEPIRDEKDNYVGRKYTKLELLETSIVPVPSNPQALIEARSKGIINDAEIKYFTMKNNIIIEKEEPMEKSGASISAKNKQALQEIHDTMHKAISDMKGCRDRLKEFMVPTEDDPEDPNCPMETDKLKTAKQVEPEPPEIIPEIVPEIIPEIISEVIPEIVPEIDELNIEGMEDPDEIDITEEEFEKAISNLLDKKLNQIKGGI